MSTYPVAVPVGYPVASSQSLPRPQATPPSGFDSDTDSLRPAGDPPIPNPSPLSSLSRVRARHVEWVQQRLSPRDHHIIATVSRLRLVTGAQLGRLHFADLSPASRDRTRRRVLHRLVGWRVLATLSRRVGGVRAGSAGLIYTLDTAGTWLIRHHGIATGTATAPRRPGQPGAAFTSHILAVTELYVSLIERARQESFQVEEFQAESACWWPDDLGGQLKPDAHTLLATEHYRDAWWIEVDQATETIPRLRRKLLSYLDFAHRGGTGPAGVLPRVLITTPTPRRGTAIKALITGLPPPAQELFRAIEHSNAADYLINELLNQ